MVADAQLFLPLDDVNEQPPLQPEQHAPAQHPPVFGSLQWPSPRFQSGFLLRLHRIGSLGHVLVCRGEHVRPTEYTAICCLSM